LTSDPAASASSFNQLLPRVARASPLRASHICDVSQGGVPARVRVTRSWIASGVCVCAVFAVA
jgi:hypothetical protein